MQTGLAMQRYRWEAAWRDVVMLAMPMASHLFDSAYYGSTVGSLTAIGQGPNSERRSREIFDDTAVWALSRLAAGMTSLVVPKAQKWHNLQLADPFMPRPTHEEAEWLDAVRDYLFAVRYSPKAQFDQSIRKAIKAVCGLGTGILFNEENVNRRGMDPALVPFFYREVPVVQCYLGIDAYDSVDRCLRTTTMTARAAARYFGADKISAKVKEYAEDGKKSEQEFSFLHAVMPREEADEYSSRTNMPWASFWMEIETRHLVNASGYFEMPYHVMYWDQTSGSPYGESPIMGALSEIKLLQHIKKSTLQAAQQLVKPPLALAEGIYNSRINLNSGAINPGLVDGQGNLKVRPITTVSNPSFAERLIEAQRGVIRQHAYVDLFQSLTEDPRKTATQVLIENQEKGEVLGPAGSAVEAGVASAVDREVSILSRKRAFEEGSPLEAPPSMDGRETGVGFVGPLAQLRKTQELSGVQSVLQMAGFLAQYDQSVLAKIDTDATLEIAHEVSGAPRRMFRSPDEIEQIRDEAAAAAERQAAMQATQMAADAAGKGAGAVKSLAEVGEMQNA